ncbi:unnamed protein product, partial [Tetraodon nigroviridis]
LLTKDYTETSYREDGTRVTVTPEDMDRCYYQGRLARQRHSSVSISTCNGLRGYIRTGAQRYLIEPLSADDQGDHALMTFNPGSSAPAVCGVTNTSWSSDFEPPTGRSRSRSGVRPLPVKGAVGTRRATCPLAAVTILQQQKYLELYLVADFRMYEKQQRDEKAVKTRIFYIVNFVNMAYKPLQIFVALVGMEVWSSGDQISVTPPAGATLDAFMRWRNDQLVKWKKHDNAHLISGIDFEGATVGLAFIGTLCSGHSVGVVQVRPTPVAAPLPTRAEVGGSDQTLLQDHNDRAIAIGATLAHEMGHNLGMNHDDSSACACSGDSCIMAAALSWNIPQTFSSCSATSLEKFLVERGSACLLDRPDQDSLQAPPICGNGFVEQGEQCDCGKVQDCTNTCCNATTCRLTEGSQCAEGDCCDDCKLAPRSRECRQKEDECDLAEFCDGQSNVCPEDVFAVNGLPCDGGWGYCYNGSCPQRSAQCNRMYGSGATEAGRFCYDYNTKGTYFAFCKRPEKDLYIPCKAEDVMCGKLFCHGGQPNPNYGRMVTIGTCKASFYDDHTKDHGQVDPGTRCGEGKVSARLGGERGAEAEPGLLLFPGVQLERVRGPAGGLQERQLLGQVLRPRGESKVSRRRLSRHSLTPPSAQVCNHKNACQCLPGWLPPDCT